MVDDVEGRWGWVDDSAVNPADESATEVLVPENPAEGFFEVRTRPGFDGPVSSPDRSAFCLQTHILDTLRRVVAAEDGAPAAQMRGLVEQIRAARQVLAALDDEVSLVVEGVLEVLEVECVSLTPEAPVVLDTIPGIANHSAAVQAWFSGLADIADSSVSSPPSVWSALVEHVQGHRCLESLYSLQRAILEKHPADRKARLFSDLPSPTTKTAQIHVVGVRTAREVVEDHDAAFAGSRPVRFSSGLRSLDVAFTKRAPFSEPLGFIAPGEQSVIAGPTGTGKSSMSYGLVRSFAQDMVNWGLDEGLVAWFHTEEESVDKVRAAGLGPQQRWHHLADRVVVSAVGSSRARLAEALFDMVIAADRRSQSTGTDICRFLPQIVVLDYIQALVEAGEHDNTAQANTANMLLRGVQAWDPGEIAKFSGVDFRTHAGMAWPAGMESHRVAVVTFAQLKKPDDESLMFFKTSSRKHHLSDFAFEHEGSAASPWMSPSGAGFSWEVRENDMYLLKKNQIKGNSIILQNASTILMLHRSRPYDNPKTPGVGADGRPHLEDTRARLLLDKTRTGSELQFVPLEFDIQPDGFRAQYFDTVAELASAQGLFTPHSVWRIPGDPILPVRPELSPFAGCGRY